MNAKYTEEAQLCECPCHAPGRAMMHATDCCLFATKADAIASLERELAMAKTESAKAQFSERIARAKENP